MKKIVSTVIAFAISISCVPQTFASVNNAPESTIHAIVKIIIYDVNQEPYLSGSGVIIDTDGDILTNYHIIAPLLKEKYTSQICYTLDAKEAPSCGFVADIVKVDSRLDLALLRITKVEDTNQKLITMKEWLDGHNIQGGIHHVLLNRNQGDDEGISLGDDVQVLGYPGVGGESITYTKGIVSGFESLNVKNKILPYLIKTDAKINPGNSGGGAFDNQNNFVGIPSLVAGGGGNIGYIISLPVINYFLDIALKNADIAHTLASVSNQTCQADYGINSHSEGKKCFCDSDSTWNADDTRCIRKTSTSANTSAPTADFFENAWQEATASNAYSFSCTISSTGGRAVKNTTLTSEQKKAIDLGIKALKKYKLTILNTFLRQEQRIYASRTSFNSLGILDAWAADKLTIDEAAQKMKTIKKGKLELLVNGTLTYYKGKGGWKVFDDDEFATTIYNSTLDVFLTTPFRKASFMFKNYMHPGNPSSSVVYQGTLTAAETILLMRPFMSEDTANQQVPSPTTLTMSADGHLQKYNVVAKVVLGGLSFTVKKQCNIMLNGAKIDFPDAALTIDSRGGQKELSGLTRFL